MSEVVAVDGTKMSRASRMIERLNTLDDSQLLRRKKTMRRVGLLVAFPAYGSALLLGIPLSCSGNEAVGLPIIVSSLAATLGGGVMLHLSDRYKDERNRRKAEQKKNWRESMAAELKERSGVELSLEDLDSLEYPDRAPTAKSIVRYGTIEKLIRNAEGGLDLEKITLAWDLDEFKLLRISSDLRELNGKALA